MENNTIYGIFLCSPAKTGQDRSGSRPCCSFGGMIVDSSNGNNSSMLPFFKNEIKISVKLFNSGSFRSLLKISEVPSELRSSTENIKCLESANLSSCQRDGNFERERRLM